MGPFYASIEDVDFRKEFNETITRELARYPIKMGEVVTTPRMVAMAELNQIARATAAATCVAADRSTLLADHGFS